MTLDKQYLHGHDTKNTNNKDTLDIIKIKNSSAAKNALKKAKRQLTE